MAVVDGKRTRKKTWKLRHDDIELDVPIDPTVRCFCGRQDKVDDYVQCDKCRKWSHQRCYFPSAKKRKLLSSVSFVCKLCDSSDSEKREPISADIFFSQFDDNYTESGIIRNSPIAEYSTRCASTQDSSPAIDAHVSSAHMTMENSEDSPIASSHAEYSSRCASTQDSSPAIDAHVSSAHMTMENSEELIEYDVGDDKWIFQGFAEIDTANPLLLLKNLDPSSSDVYKSQPLTDSIDGTSFGNRCVETAEYDDLADDADDYQLEINDQSSIEYEDIFDDETRPESVNLIYQGEILPELGDLDFEDFYEDLSENNSLVEKEATRNVERIRRSRAELDVELANERLDTEDSDEEACLVSTNKRKAWKRKKYNDDNKPISVDGCGDELNTESILNTQELENIPEQPWYLTRGLSRLDALGWNPDCYPIGTSQRNVPLICFGGYVLAYRKSIRKNTVHIYSCTNRNCKGSATVTPDDDPRFLVARSAHNHKRNEDDYLTRKKVKSFVNSSVSSRNGIHEVDLFLSENDVSSHHYLPKRHSIRRRINRDKIGPLLKGDNFRVFPPILSLDSSKTKTGGVFYRERINSEDGAAALFVSDIGLQCMRNSDLWMSDGIISLTTKEELNICQLYVISCKVNDGVIECAYALTDSRSEKLYGTIWDALIQLGKGEMAPKTFLSDFEIAPGNALKRRMPNLHLTFCNTHLSRAVCRKAQQFGMKTTDIEDRLIIRSVLLLSLLEVEIVTSVFDRLVRIYGCEGSKHQVFLSYFAKNYIGYANKDGERVSPRYSIRNWNVRKCYLDYQTRDTNAIEAQNRATREFTGNRIGIRRLLVFLRERESIMSQRYIRYTEDGTSVRLSVRSKERQEKMNSLTELMVKDYFISIMAELPGLGRHCGADLCHLLDFLPIRCDACSGTFCNAHFTYDAHGCSNAYQKNVQVPVCPLCDKPVPTPKGISPDAQVNEHILNNCLVNKKSRIFTNRCTVKGCKKKELIPVTCASCKLNFCLSHRHEKDHQCTKNLTSQPSKAALAAMSRNQGQQNCAKQANLRQPNVSNDEALARALAASLNDTHLSPEEIDSRLAQQLQQEEYQERNARRPVQSGNGSSCSIS